MGEAVAERIAEGIAALHTEYYGYPPGSAHAIIHEYAVVVVLEEAFTKAERKMIELGEVEEIQGIRRRFEHAMAADFQSVVEAATSREVRSFVSDTDVRHCIAIEVFLLGAAKTDMADFEFRE
jgi:uncharacterized protein YbcI